MNEHIWNNEQEEGQALGFEPQIDYKKFPLALDEEAEEGQRGDY